MKKKVYFSFFILNVILSQGTLATFLEENVGKSSKFLVRQKRVIDRSENGETPIRRGEAAYIVNLKKSRQYHCIATILSHHTAITAARCVASSERTIYTVHSGSTYSNRGVEHNVTDKKVHGNNPSRAHSFQTGIALITVNPPFVFSSFTGSIGLHSGPVLAGMVGTVFGWGTHANSGPVETAYPKKLRSITVPIISHRDCLDLYRGHFPITDEDICTFHPQRLCGDTDAGAPLVIDNQVVGVHIGFIPTQLTECPTKPDVFILLQHLSIGPWIMRNIV